MIEELSPEGAQRREQILRLAQVQARHRRRRRISARGLLLIAVIAAAVGTVTHFKAKPGTSPQPQIAIRPAPAPATLPSAESAVTIEYIQTDPTITDRLTLRPEPPRWTQISDAELLRELADARQPAGIVTMNGKTFLLPR